MALKRVISCSSVQPSEKKGSATVVVGAEEGAGPGVLGAGASEASEVVGTRDFFLGGMVRCLCWIIGERSLS